MLSPADRPNWDMNHGHVRPGYYRLMSARPEGGGGLLRVETDLREPGVGSVKSQNG